MELVIGIAALAAVAFIKDIITTKPTEATTQDKRHVAAHVRYASCKANGLRR